MKFWQDIRNNKPSTIAIALVLVFVAINSFFFSKDNYLLSLIPFVLLVFLLFIKKLETSLLCIAFFTPLSVNYALIPGTQLSMPGEPLMILFTIIFVFRVLVTRGYDRRILRHPVTIVVLLSLLWMLICCCCSQLPLVSFKYLLARLWFMIPFFFATAQIFQNTERLRQFFWCYGVALMIVVVYATVRTLGQINDLTTIHRVMWPFYNDHTAYGCAIALLLPAACYFLFNSKIRGWARIGMFALMTVLLVGFYFSYCRAAWLSVIGALCMYIAIRIGVKLKWIALGVVLAIAGFFAFQGDILYSLSKNHQDSTYDLASQVKSISNISTDASNLERLNRWASAIRLWEDHPVVGNGPGTYQFLYGSHQRSYQLSVISTNAGNLGNAHSEYIGPLSEQGLPGTLLIAAIFITTFATGVRVYRTARNRNLGKMCLAFTLALLTYYIHGFFNNFLDTDKLSVPFWAFTAAVVAIDLATEKRKEDDEQDENASTNTDAPVAIPNVEE